MASFLQDRHNGEERLLLTEDFRMEPTPVGFKGIHLLPSQMAALAAIVDIENKRTIRCNGQYLRVSGAVLSEPFGSGKTIIMLGLILQNKIPKPYTQITPQTGDHFITKRIRDTKSLLTCNLIIVSTSCLDQWIEAIRTFTPLRVFSIGHYNEMLRFIKLLECGAVNAFDIILLKNGTITGKLGFEDDETVNNRSTVKVMEQLTKNYMWSRVLFDDFDTINSGGNFNSIFNLYVSTTKYSRNYRNRGLSLNQMVLSSTVLMNTFNVRSHDNFIEESVKLPIVNCWICKYANPNDKMIGLIGAIDERDMADIVEMINGGAVKTLADRLGITVKSPSDIFRRVLGNQYEKFLKVRSLREHIAKIMDVYAKTEPLPTDMPLNTVNVTEIIKKVSARKYVEIPYSTGKLTEALNELNRETSAEFMRLNAGINRVFDNIRNGECGVCLSNFDSEDTCYCLRCCGALFCEACLADANQLKAQYDVISKTNQPTGSCANCKARIYMNDVIGVPAKFNIEDIIKMLTQETNNVEPEPEFEVQNPKLQALLDIIRGKTPDNMEKFTKNIRNLMQGKNDVPYTGTDRKVLVFASFNETLEIIEDLLKQVGIKFESLHGTHNEISQTVKRFQESGTVLLINSRTHCAGLNIQFATDIVYAHKIMDANIEAQVAGRGQRIGRKFNLNIWYLLFANEQEALKRQYTEH